MHIVHHFTELRAAGGGVPRAVLDLVRGLASTAGPDDRVTLLTASGSDAAAAISERDELRVVPLEEVVKPLERLTRNGRRTADEVLAAADVLHLHGLWRLRNAQLAVLARRRGLPYVVSPHGMLNPWALRRGALRKRIYWTFIESRTVAGAETVLFAAQREREQAPPGRVDPARMEVLPLVMDLEGFRAESVVQEADPGPSTPTLLMLGRLHPGKRIEVAIEVLAELRAKGNSVRLWIAGEGDAAYTARLRRLAERRGVAEHTNFLGWVTGDRKRRIYETADVLLLPTVSENFGLVLFEAMACGTPVVTTKGADTWREVVESGGGRVVEGPADGTEYTEDTVEGFVAALEPLLADESLRRGMGRAGRDWVQGHLDPAVVTGRYWALYRRVADRSSARRAG